MQRPGRHLLAVLAVYLLQLSISRAGSTSSAAPTGRELLAAAAPALFVRTPSRSNTITDIYVDQLGKVIPQSFLGLSHEWGQVEQVAANRDYVNLLKQLTSYGTGPLIFRIGGSSTDRQEFVPGDNVWRSLKSLHEQTGCTFMIGLNFEKGDIGLARRQMQAAKAGLPAKAIHTFEIGNEPNYYVNKQTPEGLLTGNEYVRCCLVQDFTRFAEQLSCPNGYPGNGCTFNSFAGPAWGHISMFPSTMQWFLQNAWRWTSFTTVHWYKAQMEDHNTPVTLIEEGALRSAMDVLKQLIDTAGRWNKQLRVAESNTLSNGGKPEVCNTMGAALWTLDGSIEVAKTGSTGINFHQSSGQAVYTAIHRNARKDAYVQAPFYGMMFFQRAVQGGAQFVNSNSYGGPNNVKVYPLRLTKTKKLRALLLNKDQANAATITLRLNRSSGYGGAELTRFVSKDAAPLYGRPNTLSIGGMRWAGRGANMTGTATTEYIKKQGPVDGKLTYTVYMPAGSAAIIAWY